MLILLQAVRFNLVVYQQKQLLLRTIRRERLISKLQTSLFLYIFCYRLNFLQVDRHFTMLRLIKASDFNWLIIKYSPLKPKNSFNTMFICVLLDNKSFTMVTYFDISSFQIFTIGPTLPKNLLRQGMLSLLTFLTYTQFSLFIKFTY